MLPPYLTYHRLSPAGELVESREVEVPGPTMMHDFAITENHVVWLDLPVVFDLDLAMAEDRGMPFRWDDAYGARLGVMPRSGDGPVRWFDVDPCYVFHVGNAHEDAAGRIVLDGARYLPEEFTALWGVTGGAADPVGTTLNVENARLHRWILDPSTGKAVEHRVDDRRTEFPTHNASRTGREHRYLYTVVSGAIVKYDLRAGSSSALELGTGMAAGEAVFVPAEAARAEDDGWLLSIVSDRAGAGSELLVLNAADLSRAACVRLPRRVPAGFHGSWIPDA